jgi:hypothetical protein
MSAFKRSLVALAFIGALSAGAALAQTPAPAPSTGDKMKAATDDVSKWSKKQWNAAKAKWSQEKDKWDGCNKQATDQKLKGRKSWSFIYTCMSS